jgi:hypothetical protein
MENNETASSNLGFKVFINDHASISNFQRDLLNQPLNLKKKDTDTIFLKEGVIV